MNSKLFLFAIMFLLVCSFVFAENYNFNDAKQKLEGKQLSGFASTLLSNERIIFHVNLDSGEEFLGNMVVKNSVITSVGDGELENPTLAVYSSENIVNSILISDNPSSVFQTSLENGDITYEAFGFFNKIKFGVTMLIAKVKKVFTNDEKIVSEQNNLVENSPITLSFSDGVLTDGVVEFTLNGNPGNAKEIQFDVAFDSSNYKLLEQNDNPQGVSLVDNKGVPAFYVLKPGDNRIRVNVQYNSIEEGNRDILKLRFLPLNENNLENFSFEVLNAMALDSNGNSIQIDVSDGNFN